MSSENPDLFRIKEICRILCGYMKFMEHSTENVVFHLECRNGDTTLVLSEFLHGFKSIFAADTSEELIREAKLSLNIKGAHFTKFDIKLYHLEFNMPVGWGLFDKLFCFSCIDWIKHPKMSLRNVKDLLKPKGECLFAFVAHSPVYDTYEKLAQMTKWKCVMEDYREVIPFTHNTEEPHAILKRYMEGVGLQVERCETLNICEHCASSIFTREHVRDTNQFIARIHPTLRPAFIDDCVKLLAGGPVLQYKWVVAFAKAPPEVTTDLNESGPSSAGKRKTNTACSVL